MKAEFMGQTWYDKLEGELQKPYITTLKERLREAYRNNSIYPRASECFKAFKTTPFNEVKVVILGQDPYPNAHAHGLAFSSKLAVTPASLRVIFRELDRSLFRTNTFEEYKQHVSSNNLTCWATQGVLLLNSVLTVEENSPGSHNDFGWQQLTGEVIRLLWEDARPKAFVCWGVTAHTTFKEIVDEDFVDAPHLILQSGHPATAAHGKDLFSNNNHFLKINQFLYKTGQEAINWNVHEENCYS